MSVETLAVIISAAGLLITLGGGLFAGFAWMIRRSDGQFAQLRSEFREEFREVHENFREVHEKFRGVDEKFGEVREEFRVVRGEIRAVREDLQQLRGELTEVKISVARLEGPRDQIIWPRGTANR